jgi:hypothetical protein
MNPDLLPALSAGITLFAIFGAPLWVPVAMLIHHGFAAKKFWQFSLGFLLSLTAAEGVALAISLGFYRLMTAAFPDLPGK